MRWDQRKLMNAEGIVFAVVGIVVLLAYVLTHWR